MYIAQELRCTLTVLIVALGRRRVARMRRKKHLRTRLPLLSLRLSYRQRDATRMQGTLCTRSGNKWQPRVFPFCKKLPDTFPEKKKKSARKRCDDTFDRFFFGKKFEDFKVFSILLSTLHHGIVRCILCTACARSY